MTAWPNNLAINQLKSNGFRWSRRGHSPALKNLLATRVNAKEHRLFACRKPAAPPAPVSRPCLSSVRLLVLINKTKRRCKGLFVSLQQRKKHRRSGHQPPATSGTMKFPLALVCLLCVTPVLSQPLAGNSTFHIYRFCRPTAVDVMATLEVLFFSSAWLILWGLPWSQFLVSFCLFIWLVGRLIGFCRGLTWTNNQQKRRVLAATLPSAEEQDVTVTPMRRGRVPSSNGRQRRSVPWNSPTNAPTESPSQVTKTPTTFFIQHWRPWWNRSRD